jgi:hypothetical protein
MCIACHERVARDACAPRVRSRAPSYHTTPRPTPHFSLPLSTPQPVRGPRHGLKSEGNRSDRGVLPGRCGGLGRHGSGRTLGVSPVRRGRLHVQPLGTSCSSPPSIYSIALQLLEGGRKGRRMRLWYCPDSQLTPGWVHSRSRLQTVLYEAHFGLSESIPHFAIGAPGAQVV